MKGHKGKGADLDRTCRLVSPLVYLIYLVYKCICVCIRITGVYADLGGSDYFDTRIKRQRLFAVSDFGAVFDLYIFQDNKRRKRSSAVVQKLAMLENV